MNNGLLSADIESTGPTQIFQVRTKKDYKTDCIGIEEGKKKKKNSQVASCMFKLNGDNFVQVNVKNQKPSLDMTPCLLMGREFELH